MLQHRAECAKDTSQIHAILKFSSELLPYPMTWQSRNVGPFPPFYSLLSSPEWKGNAYHKTSVILIYIAYNGYSTIQDIVLNQGFLTLTLLIFGTG